MRVVDKFLISIFLLSLIPIAGAGAPKTLTDIGPVFGGAHMAANTSGTVTLSLDDLPSIVEELTASWCEPCVDVADALHEIEEEVGIQVYANHRNISESMDPLGNEIVDQRWIDRYSLREPPVVVFNGTILQSGGLANGVSLVEDFTAHAQTPMDVGNGETSLTWVNSSETTGTITWAINGIDEDLLTDGTLESMIWFVEDFAHYEDGMNGEEYYPYVVREIIYLGSNNTGSTEVTLPSTWDDSDLQIHLIHQINKTVVVEDNCLEIGNCDAPPTEDESFLPGFSVLMATTAMMAAAIKERRRRL
jgi:thiol-disulfide isomerase/thioredoxin